MSIAGRTGLVTDASGGLGRETARQLAGLGWTVWIGARRLKDAEAVAGEIGERARPVQLDVTDAASISAALHAAGRAGRLFGRRS
ncbi:MAG: SDR family NAD(P)-dependent oxidoreductase [Caulobacterales bacterium]|nr:SDR family NAD(P)-dependent oxidoreductase [Caulobacterales bacterium]